MALTLDVGVQITLEQAGEWTANYRHQNPNAVKGQFYGTTKILSILATSGVVGIRIYNGIDNAGDRVQILVGADANGNDITSGVIVEVGIKCPPACGAPNLLNGL